jgi:hypothetical protein
MPKPTKPTIAEFCKCSAHPHLLAVSQYLYALQTSVAGSQVRSSRGHARKAGAYARTGKWKDACTSSELCGVMEYKIDGLKLGKSYEVSVLYTTIHYYTLYTIHSARRTR